MPAFESTTLLAYATAALVLVVAPGPAQALIVTRSIEGGTRAGLLTGAGLELATLAHTLLAAFGLSAVLAASASAYAMVRYAGAAYLLVLGVRTLMRAARGRPAAAPSTAAVRPGAQLLVHGALTGLLNPKVALFFLAFLPQFVRPERGAVLVQFLVLGLILVAIGGSVDVLIAVLAGRTRTRWLGQRRLARWREGLTGTVLLGLGLRLAFGGRG